MESKKCKFKIITPVFSYGADNSSAQSVPEIRPTSIKGMMRYMFRITQPTLEVGELLNHEKKIFGDAETAASPLRLAVSKQNLKIGSERFLLHKPSFKRKFIQPNQPFSLLMRLRPKYVRDHQTLDWYQSLLELSFLLIGIGQRSRKGRGRAQIESNEKGLKSDVKCKIKKHLNNIMLNDVGIYELSKDEKEIEFKPNENQQGAENRPVIEKIVFGKPIKNQGKIEAWQKLLKNIDQASHDIKKRDNEQVPIHASLIIKKTNSEAYFATGSVEETGCRNKKRGRREGICEKKCICDYKTVARFSSSIIVGAVETTEGLLPIYTCVKAVVEGKVLDNAETEWGEFIKKVEGKGGEQS